MKLTLKTTERLKSKKQIRILYSKGKSLKVYPLRMVYLKTSNNSNTAIQFGVSVPKRNFKKAVDRNKLKRLLRESYRLQKNKVSFQKEKSYIFMISYLGKDILTYQEVEKKMTHLLTNFNEIAKNDK